MHLGQLTSEVGRSRPICTSVSHTAVLNRYLDVGEKEISKSCRIEDRFQRPSIPAAFERAKFEFPRTESVFAALNGHVLAIFQSLQVQFD